MLEIGKDGSLGKKQDVSPCIDNIPVIMLIDFDLTWFWDCSGAACSMYALSLLNSFASKTGIDM